MDALESKNTSLCAHTHTKHTSPPAVPKIAPCFGVNGFRYSLELKRG